MCVLYESKPPDNVFVKLQIVPELNLLVILVSVSYISIVMKVVNYLNSLIDDFEFNRQHFSQKL